VVRHGDRTPKQKMKMKVTDKEFLSFFSANSKKGKELKLKTPREMQKVLTRTIGLI